MTFEQIDAPSIAAFLQAQLEHGPEYSGDMAMGGGTHDVEGGAQTGDGGAALEQDLEALDEGEGSLG